MESILFTIVVLIISIIIHEVAHGYAAYALGDPTAKLAGRLTLNPIPHVDLVGSILIPGLLVLSQSTMLFGWAKPVPYNPYNLKSARWGEAIVGFAGVGTNLLLALVFALIARFAFGTEFEAFVAPAATIAYINLFLGMFNLIPLPPLDGYTVLRGLLPIRFSLMFRELEDKILRGGIFSLVLILVIFSLFLAKPFSVLVQMVFRILVG